MQKNGKEIKFLSLYVEGNEGWFPARYLNGLFNINFLTGETKFIGRFPYEDSSIVYRSIVSCKNQLFFIPSQGNVISIYNRIDEAITCLDIPEYILSQLYTDRFAFAFEYCDSIYMFGLKSAIILKFDVMEKTFTVINVFSDSMSVKSFSSTSFILINEDKVYTIINDAKEIIEITLKDFSYRILKINRIKGNFVSLTKDSDKLWITDTEGELLEYDLNENRYHIYSVLNNQKNPDKETEIFAWHLYIYEDKVYMIAGVNHKSYIFDISMKNFKENDKFMLEPHKEFPFGTCATGPIWFLPVEHNNMVYFQWEADLTLRILDLKNNQLKVFPVLIDKKYYDRVVMEQRLKKDGCIVETKDEFSLELYLNEI